MPARSTTSPAISGRSQYTPLIQGRIAGLGVDFLARKASIFLANTGHCAVTSLELRTVEFVVDPIRIVYVYLFFVWHQLVHR